MSVLSLSLLVLLVRILILLSLSFILRSFYLENDDEEGGEGLDDAELESSLLTEPNAKP